MGGDRASAEVAAEVVDFVAKQVQLLNSSCKKITDLLVNITQHALKPKHQVLNHAEKQKLLEKYSIQEKQLPRLLVKDAVARYYGLESGQVVKVTHSSEITGLHVTYRRVW